MIRKAGVESPESRAERAHFPEELHAAGLRLFDLIASVDLPDLTRLPEKDRISTLRKKFEEIYDIEHPSAPPFFLGNPETVRIIGGKEYPPSPPPPNP